jgi:nucleoside 2-deoxyribosyltransferase
VIHVVGGTYIEHCLEPNWSELVGSGLRASLALAALPKKVHFSTFIGTKEKPVLEAKAIGFHTTITETAETVRFRYLHPLSTPSIEPEAFVHSCEAKPQTIQVQERNILRFGMIEGSAMVKGEMVTYDPQSPNNPRLFTENGSVANRLAVVANWVEARRLTGQEHPEKACAAIVRKGAEIAVVKCGSAGCVVATSKKISRVPAYRTSHVFPIGSGDVFSALFAYAWMELGMTPVNAATFASKGTSAYVERGLPSKRKEIQKHAFSPLHRLPRSQHKMVYLAGPFFSLAQRWLIEEFYAALKDAGVRVFSPLHDVGRGGPEAVYAADMAGLGKSGVVLACLDGLDPGTIYEVGYAHRLGIPVVALVSAEPPEDLKMIIGGGSQMTKDFATALYLTVWAATCK